jgi:hypothetical protein
VGLILADDLILVMVERPADAAGELDQTPCAATVPVHDTTLVAAPTGRTSSGQTTGVWGLSRIFDSTIWL